MPNFEQMYFTLFNAISDAIESIDEANYGIARTVLVEAQQKSEEIYIESDKIGEQS